MSTGVRELQGPRVGRGFSIFCRAGGGCTLIWAMLILAGCCTAPTTDLSSTSRAYRAPVRVPPRIVAPLKELNRFQADFLGSERTAMQWFRWDVKGCTWAMRLASRTNALVGVVFSPIKNIPVGSGESWLTFEIKPSHAAQYVEIVLLGDARIRNGRAVYSDLITCAGPASDYMEGTRGDVGYIAIPLSAFSGGAEGEDLATVSGLQVRRAGWDGETRDAEILKLAFQLHGLEDWRWGDSPEASAAAGPKRATAFRR